MSKRADQISSLTEGRELHVRKHSRNRRARHKHLLLYRGPLLIPDYVEPEPGAVYLTTHRAPVLRFADEHRVYLFRVPIPESRAMVGEIVLTPEHDIRVHCWAVARPSATYREVEQLIGNNVAYTHPPQKVPEQPILPPMGPPVG